jgi:hypothetical protein
MTADGRAGGSRDDERFDEAVRDLLAERGRTTNGDVRAILDGLDALPARAGGRARSRLTAAAAVAILVIGGGLALGRIPLPNLGQSGIGPGPAVIGGDRRLTECEAQIGSPAAQAFVMTHAAWFPLYFPGWSRGAPELEVDDPALVVIGPEMPGRNFVPRANDDPTPATTPSPTFRMCIAVGTPDDATLHDYGYTWFDRIVPVLSAEDVARAQHLDPDVLADPAAWRFPDRLAPCGGITGNERYVFEMVHLSDFPRHFPSSGLDPFAGDDAPAVVVVYRDPLPISRLAEMSPNPNAHDVCVAVEAENAQPDHQLLPGVDITGFHVRIDADPPLPSIGPTIQPSEPLVTIEPLPAWAADASTVLQCVRKPVGDASRLTSDVVAGDSPDTVLAYAMDAIRHFDYDLPTAGYEVFDRVEDGRLYVVRADGHIRAAFAVTTQVPRVDAAWILSSVASCDPAEFDPATPTGRFAFGRWLDPNGSPPPSKTLRAVEDCYQGTQVVYAGSLYVRIPFGGVDPSQLETTWDADVALPSTAIDTKLASGAARLFVARDGGALYVATDGRAERLPHVIGDEVVRTDCN